MRGPLILIGTATFLVVGIVLVGVSGLAFPDAFFLSSLLTLLPTLAFAQLPEEEVEIPRLFVYLSTAAALLAMGGLGTFVGVRRGGLEAIAWAPLPTPALWGWVATMTASALLILFAFTALTRVFGLRESWILNQLLPRTAGEKAGFVLVSISAGVGEELAFRGFALVSLMTLGMNPWLAVVLVSLAFGAAHSYQGWLGFARAGSIGALFALPVVLVGSVIPGIIAHAAVDVLAGIVLPRHLLGSLPHGRPGGGGADGPRLA